MVKETANRKNGTNTVLKGTSNDLPIDGGIEWQANTVTKTLTIKPTNSPQSGYSKGQMKEYNINVAPWDSTVSEDGWKIVLEEGLINIGNSAFSYNEHYTGSITIPSTVKKIETNAFSNCSGLDGTLTLQEGLTEIDNNAFSGCSKLKGDIIIPNTVTRIGQSVFQDCSGFDGVLVIGEKVQRIDNYAFARCSSIKGILTIPSSVAHIYPYAFLFCSNIDTIVFMNNSAPQLGTESFCLEGDKTHHCYTYNNWGKTSLNWGVIKESKFAFHSLLPNIDGGIAWERNETTKTLTIATAPAPETSEFLIGQMRDYTDCGPWGKISEGGWALVIEEGVFKIGSNAFKESSGLWGELIIPQSITEIGESAFFGVSGLSGMDFKCPMPTLGMYSFALEHQPPEKSYTCKSFKDWAQGIIDIIGISGPYTLWKFDNVSGGIEWRRNYMDRILTITPASEPEQGYSVGQMKNYTDCGPWGQIPDTGWKLVLAEGITNIGDYSFNGCNCFNGEVLIPSTVNVIGQCAFKDCTEIQTVEIGSKVSEIQNSAFEGDYGITAVIFKGESVNLGENSFLLDTTTKPHSCGSPGNWANGKVNTDYVSKSTNWIMVDTNVIEGGITWFKNDLTKELVISPCDYPEEGYEIGQMKDYGSETPWGKITESGWKLVLAEGVTLIGQNAFAGCESFTELTIPASVGYINAYAFMDCRNVREIKCLGSRFFMNDSNNAFSLGNEQEPVRATVRSPGWASDTYFTDAIRGAYTTFDYKGLIEGRCGDNLTFKYDEATNTLAIHGYGDMWNFGGGGAPWYYYRDSMLSVELPEGLTSIGIWAFGRCVALRNINIPDTVKVIESQAFWLDTNITSVRLSSNSRLETVGINAFDGCAGLTDIRLPDTVTVIPHSCFQGCISLRKVPFGTKVSSIGKWAFKDSGLSENIVFPETLKDIDEEAFLHCIRLSSSIFVFLSDSKPKTGNGCFNMGTSDASVSITAIGKEWVKEGAFTQDELGQYTTFEYKTSSVMQCGDNIYAYWIEDYDTLIVAGTGAMWDYGEGSQRGLPPWDSFKDNIGDVTFSNGITYIGTYAFFDAGIMSFDSMDVEIIGEGAFQKCGRLWHITLSNVKMVKDYAFADSNLEGEVIFESKIDYIGERAFSNTFLKKLSLDTEYIGRYAFTLCRKMESAVINGNNVSIDAYAFSACDTMTSLTLPNNLVMLGEHSFENCAINSLNIPDTLQTIGKSAFEGCTQLKSVEIGKSVSLIQESAFYGASSVNSLIFRQRREPTMEQKSLSFGKPGAHAIVSVDDAPSWVSLPILQSASDVNTEFIIHLSNKCGDNLTYRIDGTKLTIEGFGDMWDYSDEEPTPWADISTTLTMIELPDGMTGIGNYAFKNTSKVGTIHLPSALLKIGVRAFNGSGISGIVFKTAKDRLRFGNGLMEIGDYAFADCTRLTIVNLPPTVETIGEGVFSDCSLLKTVTLGNVKTINSRAFANCVSIVEMVFPQSVGNVGKEVMIGCFKLYSVRFDSQSKFSTTYESMSVGTNIRPMMIYAYGSEWVKEGAFDESETGQYTTFIYAQPPTPPSPSRPVPLNPIDRVGWIQSEMIYDECSKNDYVEGGIPIQTGFVPDIVVGVQADNGHTAFFDLETQKLKIYKPDGTEGLNTDSVKYSVVLMKE